MQRACVLGFLVCVACGSPQAPVVAADVAPPASAAAPAQDAGAHPSEPKKGVVYTLPPIKSGEALSPARFTVTVRDGALFLNGDNVAKTPADSSRGFDAEYKRGGANDLYLVPLADKVKSAPAAAANDTGAKAARLELAPNVSYRMLIEIMFTLGQNEITKFAIVAPSADGKLTEIRITPPKSASDTKSVLGLTVLATTEGIGIKARGGNIAPGCMDAGPGLAFKNEGSGGYRAAELPPCLTRLKNISPDAANDTTVTFTASPSVMLPDVVTLVDTIRGEKRELFPDVFFGVAR
jgi:hypothetical protein